MCSPTLILFTASTALQVASGYQQAAAQRAAGDAEGNYYDAIAESSRRQGELELQRGQKQSEIYQEEAKEKGKQIKREGAEVSAGQKTALAASGVYGGVTAIEDIPTSTMTKVMEDELALRYNADYKSWGATTDASYKNWAAQAQATNYEYAGRYSRYAGKINARNTILGTWSNVGMNAAMFGAMGGFKPLANIFKPASSGAAGISRSIPSYSMSSSSFAPLARKPAGALPYDFYTGKGFVSF